VIFDSDMGANIDTALALAILYGAPSKLKLIGFTTTNPGLEGAAFCDLMARFYTTGGKLNVTPPKYHFPVGYPGEGKPSGQGMLAKTLALKSPDGSPVFGIDVKEVNDTAEVAIIVRNALTSQKDGEGVIVAASPATNLMRSLAMPGNRDLIAAKVGTLILAAGSFAGPNPDPRIKADLASAKRLFAEWPSPIVVVGTEMGLAVPYPGTSIATDFAWAPFHPVAEAWKAAHPLTGDAPSQAAIAALLATNLTANPALNSKDSLFRLSEPGTIVVQDDGRTKFLPAAAGKHRYLIPGAPDSESEAAWKERVVKGLTSLASAKPATPGGRGFRPGAPPNQQQTPPQPPKPQP
jgi:hypothetical protein